MFLLLRVWVYLHAILHGKLWKMAIYDKVVHYGHWWSFTVIDIGTN